MTPNSDSLKETLLLDLVFPVKIKAMVGDYHKFLTKNWFWRIFVMGADALIKLIFQSETDWVIGCPEQRKQLNGPNAKYQKNFEYNCIHGKQFDLNHPKKGKRKAKIREEIAFYFESE